MPAAGPWCITFGPAATNGTTAQLLDTDESAVERSGRSGLWEPASDVLAAAGGTDIRIRFLKSKIHRRQRPGKP